MSQTPKRHTGKFVITILIIAALMLGTVFTVGAYILINALEGLSEWFTNYGCLGEAPYSETMIEQMGNLTIPTSAQNLEAYSIAFQDCVVYISFEMSANDLAALLESSHVEDVTLTVGNSDWMDSSVDWQFSEDESYLYGTGVDGVAEFQTIIIDISNAQFYKVYIISDLL